MRVSKTISITLPPEMLSYATKTAKAEHRTMSELIREALRCYESMRAWGNMRNYTASHAIAHNITEEDVNTTIKQARGKLWQNYKKTAIGRTKRKPRND